MEMPIPVPQTSTPNDENIEPDTAPPTIESDVPPRRDVGAGTDHPMEEDEAPMTGAHGGDLVSYGDGVAVYSDGTKTDGQQWMPVTEDDAVTSSAWARITAAGR